ncbi:hypothetical protein [Marinilabilia salmonicolor]|uniref:hypothetical protein n=1 Tax=Marinilabilia salmonicolor TaxID=989 RepID=UPI00029ADF69|nr:hypothetical protein [Marinilabilia salmonicolor]
MKFRIQKLEQFTGEQAGIYSIFLEDEQQTMFERFLKENISLFKSEIIDITQRIRAINEKTGAREQYFKFKEGIPGDGICALYDLPEKHLRLYCIRYGSSLLILGGGGLKEKDIRAFQENEKLTEENYFLREVSDLITERIKDGEIEYTADYTQLTGNLDFNTDE